MIIFQLIVASLVTAVAYWWMKVHRIKSKLKWIPEIPGLPVLGNVLDLNSPTETLKIFTKCLKDNDGLCTIDLASYPFILVSNPVFLEFVLGKMDILNKSDEYKFLNSWLGTGLLTAPATKWKKTRKILTPAFHFSILDSFIGIFEANSDTLIELLEKEIGKDKVDIYPYCAMNTLDIICGAAMGVSINAQRNPKSDYVLAVKEKCRILIERSFSPMKMFNLFFKLTSDYYKEKEYDNILHKYTLDVISSRLEELKEKETESDNNDDNDVLGIKKRKAFLDLLLDPKIRGKLLTNTDIREEVDTFMFAGHDTTATAIGFCLYCLSTNKDVQDKILQEQKDIFDNDRNRMVTNHDLQNMKYLEMAIKESLRMYPSVPYIGRKTNIDVEYKDGHIIPAGTGIIIALYCINRNPKFFPNPEKYDPSRFEESNFIMPYTYLAFSAGPRNCIGQKFAMNLMKSVISKVIRYYELLPTGDELILAAKTVLISENGVNVKLKKRDWHNL